MSWRVIVTGAIALLLAAVVGSLAIAIRKEYPWLCGLTVLADIGIVVSGLKSVLETTKTANELRKMSLEVEKLKLEIEEKKKAAEKENSRIVVATLDEIQVYSRRIATATKHIRSRESVIYGGTTALLVIAIGAFGGSLVLNANRRDGAVAPYSPPSVSSKGPESAEPLELDAPSPSLGSKENEAGQQELELRILQLRSRASSINNELNQMQNGMKADGMGLRHDIIVEQRAMNEELGRADRALAHHDANRASFFAARAERDIQQLETFLGR